MSVLPLLSAWETYQDNHKNPDLQAFAIWLLNTETPNRTYPTEHYGDYNPSINANTLVGHLIGKLYKSMKINTKYIFSEIDLGGIDDFHFLATLKTVGETTKKDLCNQTLTEQSTGQDIIKRMVNQALIQEAQHPQDKRATLIRITEKGNEKLNLAFEKLQTMPELTIGLSLEEKKDLVGLLQKVVNSMTQN
ncbi:MarR family winged helix-turn-helix transcriptional regulator [Spirosoma areae]